jgi:cell division protein FtsW (lipid II flippase)
LPRKRRGVELVMIIVALLIALGAYIIVGVTMDGRVPPSLLGYALGMSALAGIAHIVVRFKAPYADPLFVPIAVFLNGFGLVMISRLDTSMVKAGQLDKGVAPTQLIWTTLSIGLFCAVLFLIHEPRVLQRYTYIFGLAGLVFIAIPAILPASMSEVNGAKIWIRLGPLGIQPGEFGKIALLIFFAGYLVSKRDVLSLAGKRLLFIDLPRARDLGPILIAWGASLVVMVAESDLGTSLLFFGMFLVVLYVATQRISWIIIGMLMFCAGAVAAASLFSHVKLRVDIWLHPFAGDNPTHSAYQLVQGLFSMAAGGMFGTGLGQGRPYMVPFSNTDFIMTSIGEELGLTGLMALLLVYALFVERGLRTALAARDPFVKLFACGLAFSIVLQLFVVVGGVTRLIPLTGLTTPFLSYGGSSLLAQWIIVALLVRMSDNARRPAPQAAQNEGMTQVVSTR